MLKWLDLINFALGVAGLTLAALGQTLSLFIRNVELWTKRVRIVFFAILMGDVAGDVITTLWIPVRYPPPRRPGVCAICYNQQRRKDDI